MKKAICGHELPVNLDLWWWRKSHWWLNIQPFARQCVGDKWKTSMFVYKDFHERLAGTKVLSPFVLNSRDIWPQLISNSCEALTVQWIFDVRHPTGLCNAALLAQMAALLPPATGCIARFKKRHTKLLPQICRPVMQKSCKTKAASSQAGLFLHSQGSGLMHRKRQRRISIYIHKAGVQNNTSVTRWGRYGLQKLRSEAFWTSHSTIWKGYNLTKLGGTPEHWGMISYGQSYI